MTAADGSDAFASSRERCEAMLAWLDSADASRLTHAEIEDDLFVRGQELLRTMFQDHLDLRAHREVRTEVVASDGVAHGAVEAGHTRSLSTVFGAVSVQRLAYRHRARTNLYPADGLLNLPTERHSHGVRRLAAIESTRGSFDDAADAISRRTGNSIGKRQVEQLCARAATDIDAFYATRAPDPIQPGDVLVVSVDGKGIVMRPDSLHPATKTAAAAATTKLSTRLSKGEKRNRKRMAEVGTVYTITPAPRTPTDIIGDGSAPAPTAATKWVTASVANTAGHVISAVFDEADRRDPNRQHQWVALVDGNNHQIDTITRHATTRGINIVIVIDFIHVLEYLWGAAWCFHHEGDPTAEAWVRDRATAILDGQAPAVAAGIRRRATREQLSPQRRTKADACANYLTNKAAYLDYPTALSSGWPIATGVIEGACRHLVKDRMDITGARWSTQGAEAILALRALNTNGDLDNYWHYHLDQEHQRTHTSRYENHAIPTAA